MVVTKGSVLVVDDEVNLCRILGAKLSRSGYNVVAVHDGLQAVEKVRESDFDVVLLDLILPKMDGLTALAEIRNMRSTLPVIIISACENADTVAQAKDHGVSAYVNKPFDLDDLVTLVKGTFRHGAAPATKRTADSTVLFTKGQLVKLEYLSGGSTETYSSCICDRNDHCFTVYLAPDAADSIMKLMPQSPIRVGLAGKDAYYSFTTRVLEIKPAPEHLLVLAKPGVIYRAQRREHVRVKTRIPLQYGPQCEECGMPVLSGIGETRDLSVGGACIVINGEVRPGDILKLELQPKQYPDAVLAVAQVLRSDPAEEPETDSYVIGCRFTGADDKVSELVKSGMPSRRSSKVN